MIDITHVFHCTIKEANRKEKILIFNRKNKTRILANSLTNKKKRSNFKISLISGGTGVCILSNQTQNNGIH